MEVEVQAAGTFVEPLDAGETTCPGCGEETLREVVYGLLEFALSRMLEAEELAEFNLRTEVRCHGCGWAGSRWKDAIL